MGCLESRGNQENIIRILGFQDMKQYKFHDFFFGISSNEKYLAYLQYQKIKIVNIETMFKKKEICKKKDGFRNIVSCLGYFENSKIFCCAINYPQIQIYRADNYYKLINTIKRYDGLIYDLKIINQHQILTCDKHSQIIVIDYIKKSLILKIQDHNQTKFTTRQIYFDHQNQIIICHSYNQLNFYNMNGQLIINFNLYKIYYNIHIIPNTNSLIGLYWDSLVLCKIDYKQRQLIKLKEFNNHKQLIFRAQLFREQLIILQYLDYIIVLNLNDFKIINRQRHYLKYIAEDKCTGITTNSNNYLYILCEEYIKILKILV